MKTNIRRKALISLISITSLLWGLMALASPNNVLETKVNLIASLSSGTAGIPQYYINNFLVSPTEHNVTASTTEPNFIIKSLYSNPTVMDPEVIIRSIAIPSSDGYPTSDFNLQFSASINGTNSDIFNVKLNFSDNGILKPTDEILKGHYLWCELNAKPGTTTLNNQLRLDCSLAPSI